MYINHIAHYIPKGIVPNEYFMELHGVTNEWIESRTGIRQRSKATEGETTNTMAVEAVKIGLEKLPYPKEEIDLIVGGTYTPSDTVVTLAHQVQHFLDIPDIPVVSVSSACSTFLNSVEIVEGYFAMGKAEKAVVVVSEHNSIYANERNPKAGYLWGDGAAVVFLSKNRVGASDFEVKDILTGGAATVGRAIEGVNLYPKQRGIVMDNGRDVFINACTYMPKATKTVLERNGYSIEDLDYLIPHQANYRITKKVLETLNIAPEKGISNIDRLGNTGCAGAVIGLSENKNRFKVGDKIVVTVFGGGYSYGAMLVER